MLDILLIEDESAMRLAVGEALRAEGHHVATASDGEEAVARLEERVFDLVVSDVRLPRVDGFTLLRRIKQTAPTTHVILITAYGSIEDAVAAMRESAVDYIKKPFPIDTLIRQAHRIDGERRASRTLLEARTELSGRRADDLLVGRSPSIERLRAEIAAIALSDAAVLVTGESGTGKELVARMIHDRSSRPGTPFIAVNCGALPASLIEAELFGHERGAFTGAVKRRAGRLEAANGGTLFLDEIGEMPLESQVKLLRALQEGTFEAVGSDRTMKVDIRLVTATNKDLKAQVLAGRFREDLYYRIKVFELVLPPLRARRSDLPLLVEKFLLEFAPVGGSPPALSPSAWAALAQYPFPGNVRELKHVVQHATVLARGGDIDVQHLPSEVRGDRAPVEDAVVRPLALAVQQYEREHILRTLDLTGGHKGRAAALLRISRKALWKKLRRYGIARPHSTEGEAAE
jgi:DNA-binding NtrC family response regulator